MDRLSGTLFDVESRPMNLLRAALILTLLTGLAGCALRPAWHWEKPKASDDDYERDVKFCKQQTYSGTDYMVTTESVRRMHACLESKGWRKTAN